MNNIKDIFNCLIVVLYYITIGIIIGKIARYFGDKFHYCERVLCLFNKLARIIKNRG